MDSPARWDRIECLLQDALAELALRRADKHNLMEVKPTWDDLTRHYFAEEFLFRLEVDSASRHVATHAIAPHELSSAVRWYLLFRIQCALDFLGMIFPPQASACPFSEIPRSWSDERVVEWLLVDLWVRRFDHWLKLTAIGHRGPFAFDGLEPANPAVPA